jgi:hypothetical protein
MLDNGGLAISSRGKRRTYDIIYSFIEKGVLGLIVGV